MRARLCLFVLAVAACETTPPPAIRTFALTPPAGGERAREPHLALDPADPDRLIVAAQYGEGYNRGGRRMWTWTSEDDGQLWTGREMPLPRSEATLAADAVASFEIGGRGLLLFLFADSAFRGGAVLTRTGVDDLDFGPASIAVRGDIAADGAVDKGWLATDRGPVSPFRGAVYLSYHLMQLIDGVVKPSLWLRRGDAGGTTWADPVRIAEGSGGLVAVRGSGVVDVVYMTPDERTVMHTASEDGGRSFAPPGTVATADTGVRIDLPALAVLPGDTLLACWSGDGPAGLGGLGTRCSRSAGHGAWSSPVEVGSPEDPVWFPAIVGDEGGAWLAGYQADGASTRVTLFRSTDGGRSFTLDRILGTRAFGGEGFCRSPGAPCRRDSTRFFPGDYIAVAAAPGRLAAAFTLPESDDPRSRPTIHVSLLRSR